MEHIVKAKLMKKVSLGRVLAPMYTPPTKLENSPPPPALRFIPKKTGEFRLIHHLSYPHGDSANDTFNLAICTVKYDSFDVAVDMVRSLRPSALMAKCDIEFTFRLLPVHPDNFDLLGFTFQGPYYFDKALPM